MDHPETHKILQVDDPGLLISGNVKERGDGLIAIDIGGHLLWLSDQGERLGSQLKLRIRARDVAIATGPVKGLSILNQIPVVIDNITQKAQETDVHMTIFKGTGQLQARITKKSLRALNLETGAHVYALVKAVAVRQGY